MNVHREIQDILNRLDHIQAQSSYDVISYESRKYLEVMLEPMLVGLAHNPKTEEETLKAKMMYALHNDDFDNYKLLNDVYISRFNKPTGKSTEVNF